jgi:hypothetical protein
VSAPAKSAAEILFERYLAEHGLAGGDEHQPDLGGSANARRPDYRVAKGASAAIVELKAFESSALEDALAASTGYLARGEDQELAPIRNKIGEALKQLRPYRIRPEPLIVAIANPAGLLVPSEDAMDTIAAMYGNYVYRVSVGVGDEDPPEDGEFIFDRNGVFGGGLHPYVSAVMTVHERTHRQAAIAKWHADLSPRLADITDRRQRAILTAEATEEAAFKKADAVEGTYRFVRVFETHHVASTAALVPRDLFDGPRDEFYAFDLESGHLSLQQ